MGKKSPNKYVKKLKPLEKECLKGHWRAGSFTKTQIQEEWSINDTRLKQMINSKYLKVHRGKYRIDDKGKEYCKNIGMTHKYKESSFKHDNELAKVYLDYSREERKGWMTEGDLRAYASKFDSYTNFKERMRAMHPQGKFEASPDAAIQKDGKLIGVEVVTNNYSSETIQQKQEFSNLYLDDIDYYEA